MSGTNTRKLKKNVANAKILANLTGLNKDKKTLANLTKEFDKYQKNIYNARIARNNITRNKYLVPKNMLTQKNKEFKYNKNKSKVRQNFERLRILMKNNPIKGTQFESIQKRNAEIKKIQEMEEITRQLEIENEKLDKEIAIMKEEANLRQIKWDKIMASFFPKRPQLSNNEAFGVATPKPKPNPNPNPVPKKAIDPKIEQYIRNHYG